MAAIRIMGHGIKGSGNGGSTPISDIRKSEGSMRPTVLRFGPNEPGCEMIETLYRTATPEFSVCNREHYTLALRLSGGGYLFTERYGWWDDRQKKLVNTTMTLSPDFGYATYEEGLKDYRKQKYHRATEGFVHCFSKDLDPLSATPERYEFINLDAMNVLLEDTTSTFQTYSQTDGSGSTAKRLVSDLAIDVGNRIYFASGS